MNQLFQEELLGDEQLIWCGQSEPNMIFTSGDVFLIPFSIMWGGFALFWEVSAIKMGAPFFFWLFGIPFVVIGLYFIFGRFIYKSIKKKHTYYAVTNKRVLILSNLFQKSIQAALIQQIPCISKSVGKNAIGTVQFGNVPFMAGIYGNSGMEFFASLSLKGVLAFYDIQDAEKVYQLVNKLRQQQ